MDLKKGNETGVNSECWAELAANRTLLDSIRFGGGA